MNDYLSNLVARSLEQTPVIQPRLPFLFEREAPAQEFTLEPPTQIEIHEPSLGEPKTIPSITTQRTGLRDVESEMAIAKKPGPVSQDSIPTVAPVKDPAQFQSPELLAPRMPIARDKPAAETLAVPAVANPSAEVPQKITSVGPMAVKPGTIQSDYRNVETVSDDSIAGATVQRARAQSPLLPPETPAPISKRTAANASPAPVRNSELPASLQVADENSLTLLADRATRPPTDTRETLTPTATFGRVVSSVQSTDHSNQKIPEIPRAIIDDTLTNSKSPDPTKPFEPPAPSAILPARRSTGSERTKLSSEVSSEAPASAHPKRNAPDLENGLPTVAVVSPGIAFEQLKMARSLSQPDARNLAAPATSAPTIQVTIGRIEVRAISAQSPAARKRPEPSRVIPLDEYLKQRNAKRG